MTDIVEFLTARLGEDERIAQGMWKRAIENRWEVGSLGSKGTSYVIIKRDSHSWIIAEHVDAPIAAHIARHDATRILAEVAAKRAIIGQWRQASDGYRRDDCDETAGAAWAALSIVLVSLAGAYQTHPDYKGHDMDDWEWPDGESLRS